MFERKTHTITIGERVFVLRAPTIRDRMAIQSRRQAICFEQSVFYELLDQEYREWIDETAMLETLMEQAPEEWYLTVGDPKKRVVRIMQNEALDYAVVREVGAQAQTWLDTFQGR